MSDQSPGPLPFVSVVVPTRNRRELLRALLESLARQTYSVERFDVLVVDNASTDGTEEMVRAFALAAPFRLVYLRRNNTGPSASRNDALRIARAEIVAFTDSDCVATPRWIERGVEAFEPGVGLVQGRTLPNPTHARHLLEKTLQVTEENAVYETANIFYRRDEALAAGGFSTAYDYFGEDTDLAWKVKRSGLTSAFAPEALIYHHVFRASLWGWLTEPRHVVAWPYMVRTIPELREHLYRRYFLLRITAMFDLALAGAALGAAVHWGFAALAAPYVVVRYTEAGRFASPWSRIARLVFALPRAFIVFGCLAYGSVKHRSLVL